MKNSEKVRVIRVQELKKMREQRGLVKLRVKSEALEKSSGYNPLIVVGKLEAN